jgi:protein ImuB
MAGTRTAARLLVHHRAGITVVAPGTEAAALAAAPVGLLSVLAGSDGPAASGDLLVSTLRRWGVRTLGEFAALPPGEVAARLGQDGVVWQRLACGDDPRPLVPASLEERFEEAVDLEWPIEGLEPLSFVLGRLMEPLAAHLERRGRGAAVLRVRLHLVDRTVYERALELPAPMRDARTLRTLALLDLESHPPAAAIDRVVVAVDPTPGRIVQFSLLARPLPSPEQLSTLLARLAALMGDGRCGSPAAVDAWRPGAHAMRPFAPRDRDGAAGGAVPHVGSGAPGSGTCATAGSPLPTPGSGVALRRFRLPVPARVRVEQGRPARVTTDRRGLGGGRVERCAGPWRTSGDWWRDGWDRDEWDVGLQDGATYRIFRERDADRWFVEGVVD